MNLVTRWPVGQDGDEHVAWARGLYDAVEPHLTGGVYVNFLSDEGEERTRAAYGPEKYARLVALKDRGTPTTCSTSTRTSPPPGPALRPPAGATR